MTVPFIKPGSTIYPIRPPDLISSMNYYWFDEMISARIRSDGAYVSTPIAECPLTKQLMYCNPEYARGWLLIEDEHVQKEYVDYLVEKHLLEPR